MKAMIRCLSIAGLLVGAPVLAHHSFSMFDMGKEIELKGSVREFQWTNPHIWVQVLVTGADGKTVEWSIEGNSPSTLSRQGWSKRSLVPGEKVTMTVHPLRDGSPGGSVVKILREDGSLVGDPAP